MVHLAHSLVDAGVQQVGGVLQGWDIVKVLLKMVFAGQMLGVALVWIWFVVWTVP